MKAKKKYGKGGKLYNKGGKMKKMSKIGQVSKSQADAIHRKAYMQTDKDLHERSDELKSKGRKGYSETQIAYSAYDAGNKAVKDAKSDAAKRLQVPNPQPKKSLKMKNGGKVKKLGKRGAVGAPVSNKSVKKYGKMATGSQMDTALRVPKARFSESGNLEIGSKRDGRVQSTAKKYLKTIQKSQEVPNKALKKQTKKFNTGRSKADERTYYQGNPGGLKGRTSGKGGNVGAGMKAPTKKRRR